MPEELNLILDQIMTSAEEAKMERTWVNYHGRAPQGGNEHNTKQLQWHKDRMEFHLRVLDENIERYFKANSGS